MSDIKPMFSGEVQFRRYSDTSTQGQQVVFSVADREALQPFIGMEGKRLMAVFVLIGDDEQPVQPEPVKERKKPTTGPICQWLVMRCKEADFRQWLTRRGDFKEPLSEAAASDVVRSWCGVESRKDIDGNPRAEALFKRHIQEPWSKRKVTEPA